MKSHEENRSKVCLLCFKKAIPARKIHGTLVKTIAEKILPEYNNEDEKFPKVLCQGCYRAVYRYKNGEQLQNIELHKYQSGKNDIRNKDHRECELCTVAQSNCLKIVKKKRTVKNDIIKICRKCLTNLGPGKRHLCTENTKL